jgi:hypothetical protein
MHRLRDRSSRTGRYRVGYSASGRWQIAPARRAVSVISNLMHCDTHPVSVTKLFVQLSPNVNAETGALICYRSRRRNR